MDEFEQEEVEQPDSSSTTERLPPSPPPPLLGAIAGAASGSAGLVSAPANPDRGLLWVAIGLVLLGALASIPRYVNESLGYQVGAALGAALLPALLYALVRTFASHRAALVVACVVAGLGLLAGPLNSSSASSQTDGFFRQSELSCFEAAGVDSDQLDALRQALDRPLAESAPALNTVAKCAPRTILSDGAVQGFQDSASQNMGVEVTDAEARCALESITGLPDLAAAIQDPTAMREALGQCLTPETIQAVQDAAVERELGRMTAQCEDGVDAVCDQLFIVAQPGSPARVVGETCADRGLKSPSFCAPDLVDEDTNGFADSNSPGMAELVNECRDGSMIKCDALSTLAEWESEPFEVGATCGGRRQSSLNGVETNLWCIDLFGESAS